MPTLVERKLIRFGDGGLALTIPAPWWRFYGLKPGDTVEVVTNGKLTVRPVRKDSRREAEGTEVEGS